MSQGEKKQHGISSPGFCDTDDRPAIAASCCCETRERPGLPDFFHTQDGTLEGSSIADFFHTRTGALDFAEVDEKMGTGGAAPSPALSTAQASPNQASQDQSSPPPQNTRDEEKPKCLNDGLNIQCEHAGAAYTLSLPGDKRVVQVVAGAAKNAREVTATTQISAGPCPSHDGKVLHIEGGTATSVSNTELKFDALCDPQYAFVPGTFKNFKNFWPYPPKTRLYKITASTCEAQEELLGRVECFPDVRWEAKINITLDRFKKQESEGTIDSDSNVERKRISSFGVGGSIKVSADNQSLELQGEFQKYVEQTLKILSATKNMVDYVSKSLNHVGAYKLAISWPVISIKGAWGYEEIEGEGKVGYGFELGLGLDPLIGIEGSVDIVDPLCNLIPYIGPIVAKIKRYAAKGIQADVGGRAMGAQATVAIWLTARGKLFGSLSGKKMANTSGIQVSGQVGGQIEFEIKAEVSGTLDIFFVQVQAGLEGGAKSGITGTITAQADNRGPYYQGAVEWNGITFFGAVYMNADFTTKQYQPKSAGSGRFTKEGEQGVRGKDLKRQREYVLVQPQKWPFDKHYFIESR